MPKTSLFLILASLAMTACVQTTPHWDMQFGRAARSAIASQTLNPAAANADPVAGIDGQAALGARKRYERTFAQPESQAPSMMTNMSGK